MSQKRKLEDDCSADSPKKPKWIELRDSNEDTDASMTYDQLMKNVRKRHESDWSEKVDKYVERGVSQKHAEQKADQKFEKRDMEAFLDNYNTLIKYIVDLEHVVLHINIMADFKEFMAEGHSERQLVQTRWSLHFTVTDFV